MRSTCCVVVAFLFYGSSLVFAGDWTEFRGPTGQGLSDAVGLPLTWSDTEHIDWKASLPGRAWSSPVVKGDRIFLTTAVPDKDSEPDSSGQSLRVLCLDAASGQSVWNVEAFHQAGDGH